MINMHGDGSVFKPEASVPYGWDANPWVFVISFERISKEEAMKKDFFAMSVAMTVIAGICIVVFILLLPIWFWLYFRLRKENKLDKQRQKERKVIIDFQQYEKSYSISAYYECIEKVSAEILESQKPVDKTIILWWGLDGLRLNEDGTSEWISRKKQSLISEIPKLSYISLSQGIENARYNPFDLTMCCQSSPSQIQELQAKNIAMLLQAVQNKLNMEIISNLQTCRRF